MVPSARAPPWDSQVYTCRCASEWHTCDSWKGGRCWCMELLSGGMVGYCSCAVDVWATGVLMAELLTLRPIFAGASDIDQIFKIGSTLGVLSGYLSLPGARRLCVVSTICAWFWFLLGRVRDFSQGRRATGRKGARWLDVAGFRSRRRPALALSGSCHGIHPVRQFR